MSSLVVCAEFLSSKFFAFLVEHWFVSIVVTLLVLAVAAVFYDYRCFHNIQVPWESRYPGKKYPGDKQAKKDMSSFLGG